MKAIIKKTFLYILTLAHLPVTIIRVVVATTLLIDLWCDRIINNWLNEVEKELKGLTMKEKVNQILEQYEKDSDYPKMKRELLILLNKPIKNRGSLANAYNDGYTEGYKDALTDIKPD